MKICQNIKNVRQGLTNMIRRVNMTPQNIIIHVRAEKKYS